MHMLHLGWMHSGKVGTQTFVDPAAAILALADFRITVCLILLGYLATSFEEKSFFHRRKKVMKIWQQIVIAPRRGKCHVVVVVVIVVFYFNILIQEIPVKKRLPRLMRRVILGMDKLKMSVQAKDY